MSDRPVAGACTYTQQTQKRNIHDLSVIRTRYPNNQAAGNLRLSPHAHRDRLQIYTHTHTHEADSNVIFVWMRDLRFSQRCCWNMTPCRLVCGPIYQRLEGFFLPSSGQSKAVILSNGRLPVSCVKSINRLCVKLWLGHESVVTLLMVFYRQFG